MVEASISKMTDTLSEFMKREKAATPQSAPSTLKYTYIWQNLDNLFQQLDQEDVNDLNVKFLTQTCENINSKKHGQ